MKHDPVVFLKHVAESCEIIEEYLGTIDKVEFLEDTLVQDAVIRRIQIIGEAIKNLPRDFVLQHPDVRWKDLAGMRDKLVHGYFGVDLNLVWDAIQKDLPKLKATVKHLITTEK